MTYETFNPVDDLVTQARTFCEEISAGFIDSRRQQSLRQAVTKVSMSFPADQREALRGELRQSLRYIKQLKGTLRDRERKLRAFRSVLNP